MIFNGNLDRSASNRKSRAQLVKELKNWEETIKPKSSKKPAVENAEAYVVRCTPITLAGQRR